MAPGVTPGAGRGGLPTLTLTAADGARAEIYLHGAHVTSWIPAGGRERLFVSERAEFREGASIRGGIPVIFPQFSTGALPKHGFARTSSWTVVSSPPPHPGARGVPSRAVLALRDSADTRAVWAHEFAAELTVEVGGASLAVSLGVTNSGGAPLAFTAALHSYLRVSDAARATVAGLHGVRYRDQTRPTAGDEIDMAPALGFAGEVDRVYLDAPSPLVLHDPSAPDHGALELRADGFPDVVVWNPWAEKARALADMHDDEYRAMVCVEAAAVARPVTLAPGSRWIGTQRLTVT
jgi:glucose-6-phosphate 1-epimerase